ncbi:glycosyltransferase 87 family protein [Actinoplanes sp. CA-252034]|uniref:glycosyltransferase 87 family protein n=1 Tax=Actinoplanes sp. CA-252034 TaxID=3239906 RepID=UPI003D98A7EB
MSILRDPQRRVELFLVVCLLATAFTARYVGRSEMTRDMQIFFEWHDRLERAGGWRGLGEAIGNYNAPYMYLLWFASVLPVPLLIGIKLVYAVFDLLLAFFVFRLVEMRRGRRAGFAAALVVILLPTVVINASIWGQIDSIWASFAVGGVWMLARGRDWWGVALCTLSLAFKPHGIFIFALVGLLVLAGRLRARTLLAVPAVWLALSLPALLLGRSPGELFTIYSLDRQAGIIDQLTAKAPTIFAFLEGTRRLDTARHLGYVLTAALVLGVFLLVIARRARLDGTRIVTLATLFAILIPFGLPGMHERYFYLADVLTVALVFHLPRLWFVPLLVQAASLGSYTYFLFGQTREQLELRALAALMLAALVAVGYTLIRDVLMEREITPLAPKPVGNTMAE